ncbi:MAG: KilA-N domain-containing protein [Candidatus Pacebacteria bacterium]|nr:KilA-N domain-containing protein [Candidatus Paceibacterota bacterium]
MKKEKIEIKNKLITVSLSKNENDYFSLTDMAKFKGQDTGLIISHWLTTKYTIQFMGIWEQMHNKNFNVTEFRNIKNEVGTNGFVVSSSMWIKRTNAIGVRSSAGRYGGGTFAHKDIAFEFATWISPEFKLYLIKEFQRLKIEENKKLSLEWNLKRTLSKVNYKIHTDAIKENIIPKVISKKQAKIIYASEADILNVALFNRTAKEWRNENSGKKGNIRDYANITQLVCLSNLETLNAEFIRSGFEQQERLKKLNEIAIIQMRSLVGNKSIKKLK